MSLTSALLINAVVLAATLGSDLGHRTFNHRRIWLSLIICSGVVLTFGSTFYTSGIGLTAEIVGVAVGVLIGLLAVSLMKVSKQADNTIVTFAGVGYAAVWVAMALARSLLSIGLTYWFGTDVGTWLVKRGAALPDVSGIITNFLLFMAVTAVLSRALVIRARAATLSTSATVNPANDATDRTPSH
ncbi:hypothetical protein AB0C96_41470 [Streptomyces sp. NPDC048506]|uniref:hypothetical protein n=1 Tax=Streptomyces sp. NPDC048506 TaxID=3155028 RepID=UPI00341FC1EC